jgi:hypothetical protein
MLTRTPIKTRRRIVPSSAHGGMAGIALQICAFQGSTVNTRSAAVRFRDHLDRFDGLTIIRMRVRSGLMVRKGSSHTAVKIGCAVDTTVHGASRATFRSDWVKSCTDHVAQIGTKQCHDQHDATRSEHATHGAFRQFRALFGSPLLERRARSLLTLAAQPDPRGSHESFS